MVADRSQAVDFSNCPALHTNTLTMVAVGCVERYATIGGAIGDNRRNATIGDNRDSQPLRARRVPQRYDGGHGKLSDVGPQRFPIATTDDSCSHQDHSSW